MAILTIFWRSNSNTTPISFCLLVEKSDGPVGIARQTASAANACSVVQRGFAVAHYTFAHELAHNFGCQHDRPNAATPGVYSFSYGFTSLDSNDYQQYGTYHELRRNPHPLLFRSFSQV